MCLNQASEKKVAKRNITCYKRLVKNVLVTICEDGDEFTATINGIECSGVISKGYGECVYFCTNEPKANGSNASDKHGYAYSWINDDRVHNVCIIGKEKLPDSYITPYQKFRVNIGENYTSDLILEECDDDGEKIVNVGIHSFVTLASAKDDVDHNYDSNIFVKCIIPKGSSYCVGTFIDDPSYASNSLTYVEIVD